MGPVTGGSVKAPSKVPSVPLERRKFCTRLRFTAVQNTAVPVDPAKPRDSKSEPVNVIPPPVSAAFVYATTTLPFEGSTVIAKTRAASWATRLAARLSVEVAIVAPVCALNDRTSKPPLAGPAPVLSEE